MSFVEGVNYDYKEKSDRRTGKLSDVDRENLAKAISGFANSSGGVLIWGIKDKSLTPKPIENVEIFLDNLLDLVPNTTAPPVQGVEGIWLPSDTSRGFAIIHIPESELPPHRVILKQKDVQDHYYIRTSSSFVRATHTQLEDMFGRRPRPQLKLSTRLELYSRQGRNWLVDTIVGLENKGRGAAKSPFLSIKVNPPHIINQYGIDGNMNFPIKPIPIREDQYKMAFGASSNDVIHSGMNLEIVVLRSTIKLTEYPSMVEDLIIDYRIAAEGIQVIEGQKIIDKSEFWAFK